MLKLNSFFEGHRGAVLSLAGNPAENYFYSSGSEGLIVRWQLDKPNEGQVLLKLDGYVSSLAYDEAKNEIYAAVNHKGVYVINADSGKIINQIDFPATSFGAISVNNNIIILTTKQGEIILFNVDLNKTIKRINTQLSDFSKIVVSGNALWFTTLNGICVIGLEDFIMKEPHVTDSKNISAMGLIENKLVVLVENGMIVWNIEKHKIEYSWIDNAGGNFQHLILNHLSRTIYTTNANNEFLSYRLEKKGIRLEEKSQIEHKGQINDLLWVENYKFVISASSDKKIGIWQIN